MKDQLETEVSQLTREVSRLNETNLELDKEKDR